MSTNALPPLSLYIHLPWCIRKCPYCDFNSHALSGDIPEQDYIRRLLSDLDDDIDAVQSRPLHSIFIGGGTPSLFSADALDALFKGIDQRWPISASTEITLEANPGTFEQARFSDYRHIGINRLSIGIQSFNAQFLESLGRIHDGNESLRATEIARAAGFDNLNLDLMFGLPGQSPEQAIADLDTAIGLAPSHLSWYQLTLEPNTVFHRYPPVLPDDDNLWEMHQAGLARLASGGYQRYEVSAFSQPNRQCQHNLNYWGFGDYIGIGAGAHGKLSWPSGEILRTRKTRQPLHYLDTQRIPCVERRNIPLAERPLEFMLNAMRLVEGSDRATYERHTALPFKELSATFEQLAQQGLIQQTGTRFQPTEKGLQFHNDILLAFMS